MKEKNKSGKNYLDKIPFVPESMKWEATDDSVTLFIKNKGIMNKIAQKLFKKPEVTQIHLDETGSIVWQLIDGKSSVYELGSVLKDKLGEKAEPLYERLAKYFMILESYGFVEWLK